MLKIGQICTRCKKPFGSSVSDGAAIDSLKKNYSKKKATLGVNLDKNITPISEGQLKV